MPAVKHIAESLQRGPSCDSLSHIVMEAATGHRKLASAKASQRRFPCNDS